MRTREVWGLPLMQQLLVGLLLLLRPVQAQRIHEGCYDSSPVHCIPLDEDFALDSAINYAKTEAVCRRLAMEIFPDAETFFDTSVHPEYLNTIEASDKFCTEIQQAYSMCFFCMDEESRQFCRVFVRYDQCGDQLTREEIIQEETSYALITSDEDIDLACKTLAETEQLRSELHLTNLEDVPFSVQGCNVSIGLKHLCPGHCEGGCFTEDYPPSCEMDYEQDFASIIGNSTFLEDYPEVDIGLRCSMMQQEAFILGRLGGDQVMWNFSKHLDYLKVIPGDNSVCTEFRIAYPQCIWCNRNRTDDLCFNDEYPATCTVPENQSTATADVIDPTDQTCSVAYASLIHAIDIIDLYNASAHTGKLSIKANTTLCERARQEYHNCIWCTPSDTPPTFCENAEYCDNLDMIVPENIKSEILAYPYLDESLRTLIANPQQADASLCNKIDTKLQDLASYKICFANLLRAQLCPDRFCPLPEPAEEIVESYLGATTEGQKKAIVWMSRISAMLAFLGACYILYDSLSNKQARKTVYHQLVVGMAIFDIFTAVAWCLATAPVDKSEPLEGAVGNNASCKAQGFFIQLGFASVYYNVSLATYYLLVITKGWRESRLKEIRIYLHGIPILLGLGLAFSGIQEYDQIVYVCHIPPTDDGSLWSVICFVVLPLGLSIIVITVEMLLVYLFVRKQAGVAKKWAFGVGSVSKMEEKVFWQCLWYVMAFYLTWPILFSVYLASTDENGPLGLSLTIAFLAPLQGFLNFLVYSRPKFLSWREDKRKRHQREGSGESGFTAFFHHWFTKHGDATEQAHSELRSVDPSVAIASEIVVDEVKVNFTAQSAAPAFSVLTAVEERSNEVSQQSSEKSGMNVTSSTLQRSLIPVESSMLEAIDEARPEGTLSGEGSERSIWEDESRSRARPPEQNPVNSCASRPLGEIPAKLSSGNVDATSLNTEVEGKFAAAGGAVAAQYPSHQHPRRDYRQYLLPASHP